MRTLLGRLSNSVFLGLTCLCFFGVMSLSLGLICPLYSQEIRVKAITSDGIIIDVGSDAGVTKDMKGTVYVWVTINGKSAKSRIAKFIVLSVDRTLSEAKITVKTDDIKPDYLVEFEKTLMPPIQPDQALRNNSPKPTIKKNGTLKLLTSPPGARFFIDGKETSGLDQGIILEAGAYEIKILMEGYEDVSDSITVSIGEETWKSYTLIPALPLKGLLKITTYLTGAQVYANGIFLGSSGETYLLDPGTYEIKVTQPNVNAEISDIVIIEAGKITEKSYTLVPAVSAPTTSDRAPAENHPIPVPLLTIPDLHIYLRDTFKDNYQELFEGESKEILEGRVLGTLVATEEGLFFRYPGYIASWSCSWKDIDKIEPKAMPFYRSMRMILKSGKVVNFLRYRKNPLFGAYQEPGNVSKEYIAIIQDFWRKYR